MSLTTLAGIEPAVFRLEGERIIQLCYRARIALVEFRSRHLSLTKRVLYQMSYESICARRESSPGFHGHNVKY